jgi:MFS family permease
VLVRLDPNPPAGVSRYRWLVLALTFVNQFAVIGNWYVFSVVLKPMDDELHLGRGPLSLTFSLMVITQAVAGMFVGGLLDRFSPRIVIPVGFVFCSAGAFLAARSADIWLFALSFGLLMGIGVGGAGWIAQGTVLSRWFPDRYATAVGLSSAGVGLGLLIMVPLLQYVAVEYGWRSAILAQAILVLPVGAANLALLRASPPLSRAARGTPTAPRTSASPPDERDWTLGRAVASAPFWWLFFALFAGEFSQQMLSQHQIAYLTDAGRPRLEAAFATGLLGAAAFPGKIFWGAFAQRFGRALGWTLGYLVMLAAIPLLVLAGSTSGPLTIWTYGIVIGIGFATIGPLAAPMTADLFRGRAFGAILGAVTISTGLGSAVGVTSAGYLFDSSGTYSSSLVAAGGSCLVAILCAQVALRGVKRPRLIRAPALGDEARTANG